MNDRELKRLAGVLAPLQVPKMPLAAPPPRDNRFGSPLKLSKVHWVRPEVVVEVTYLTWTRSRHECPTSPLQVGSQDALLCFDRSLDPMTKEATIERRLAAILAADIAGYQPLDGPR